MSIKKLVTIKKIYSIYHYYHSKIFWKVHLFYHFYSLQVKRPLIFNGRNITYELHQEKFRTTQKWQPCAINYSKILPFFLNYTQNVFCKVFYSLRNFNFSNFNLSRPDPGKREKINLSFQFHTSLWCLKRFYEGLDSFLTQKQLV